MSSAGPSKTEPTIDLFFAFIDGVYDYVCAECTALCCKGHGLGGSLERELRPLFTRYPQLETMAISRTGGQITFATTGGGCVLLDADNFCRIEKELGKDQKPNICNLFPFNAFSRIGKTIAVMPHFLCPLRATIPARPGEVLGTHAFIESELQKSRMLDKAYVKNFVGPARLNPSLNETATIERERSFRDRCAGALSVASFRDVLLNAAADAAALNAFLERTRRILGYEPAAQSNGRDVIDDLLLTFASPYRISLLDLSGEGVLRALGVAELIVRKAWAGATVTPSLQSIANTAATFRPIQALLADGDERFDFGRVTKKTFSFSDAELTFAAFITTQNSVEKGVLGALDEAISPGMAVADRSVLLMRLGQQMEAAKSKRKRKHGAVIDEILASQGNNQLAQISISN
jgi:hypothetical protein